jgi:transaldolase
MLKGKPESVWQNQPGTEGQPERASLQAEIARERARREALALAGQPGAVNETALQDLLFFTPPQAFPARSTALCQAVAGGGGPDGQALEQRLQFLADCYLGLVSFLPRWNLENIDRHAGQALSERQVAQAAGQVFQQVCALARAAPEPAAAWLERQRQETLARCQAERAADPEAAAKALVGDSVADFLSHTQAELAHSNLRRICAARAEGQTRTEISNDYAAFLPYAMYLGASFATTNPPLVEIAWQTDPERWDPVIDRIIADHPHAGLEGLARLATLEIVLANMRRLRPIFLLTAGQMGQVCLQVNPHLHGDAEAMLVEALFLYETLRGRLAGGLPNVLFKLPGTQAGLETCQALTRRGIGVTITVDFGMFQHLPFAEAILAGQAICSCLVEMNGRLAFPVRDELLSRCDELAQSGIDTAAARQAAAWAGIAVAKRLYTWLQKRQSEPKKIKLLVASLRIYAGPGYEQLPSACPDITELLGADLISVFPNIRRPFDRTPGLPLDPQRIRAPVPPEVLAILAHSQLFRQAYAVGGPGWQLDEPAVEPDGFQPAEPLRLDRVAHTAAWTPVHDTLSEFCASYDRFVERLAARRSANLNQA